MKIAVEGCAHGDLEKIYETIKYLEEKDNVKIDLLICCGDFQSIRNEADLRCMAVPQKYYNMCSFYKYYNGEKEAPILTLFIGGNHEASNYLQELPYGGWVAPNIYYLGYSGVINIAGIRIAGLSGIYKGRDYFKGRHEHCPYSDDSIRSVYHIRNLDVFRLKQLSQPIDIFISHDWPSGITNFGNKEQLLKFKPFLRNDIESGNLGSKPCEELLNHLQPQYWFSAHLHCRFAALVPHKETNKTTQFLALDKCLPKRKFLQIIDIPNDEKLEKFEISYDLEWLTILHLTNHLLTTKNTTNYMPGPNGNERWEFQPTENEKSQILEKMDNDLTIPKCFSKTAKGYSGENIRDRRIQQPDAQPNPQTIKLCKQLLIDDPVQLLLKINDKLNEEKEVTEKVVEKLNVPEPVADTAESSEWTLDEIGDVNLQEKPKDKLILPPPINPDLNEDIVEGESDDIVKGENDEKVERIAENPLQTNSPPAVKKFKRRNMEIYGNEDNLQ